MSTSRSGTTRTVGAILLALGLLLVVACSDPAKSGGPSATSKATTSAGGNRGATRPVGSTTAPDHTPFNAYRYTQAGMLSAAVQGVPTRVYVPEGMGDAVEVIDPATFKVIGAFPVGRMPQHVVPSWDLKTLYVNNNNGNSLTPIDPMTGTPGAPIPVDDPYNLYFTPDGAAALVMAERNGSIDFRDPHSWRIIKQVHIPHSGVNHLDFLADDTTAIASCEFSGWLVRIDTRKMQLTGELNVGGAPIDVKLAPDGSVVFVANQKRGGVSVVDPVAMKEIGFIRTGAGAHGLYPSRDGTKLYVSNRAAGSVSVIDFATRTVVATWPIPHGSPDMGGVSADGSQLWLSGRYAAEVYVLDTRSGALLARIPVGHGPHGLAIFPQPGRFSMGHTGNYR